MTTLSLPTPRVFLPLLAAHAPDGHLVRYRGAHGGRGSGKSHFFAEMLIERCLMEKTDWVCVREVQKSIDKSVKKLLEAKIEAMGVGYEFDVQRTVIYAPHGGMIAFQGMQDHTAESIKSLEGFDGAWVEEAQTLSAYSMELLRPTIRKPGSEIWFSWNPSQRDDAVETLLRSAKLPHGTIVVQANYSDNPFLPDVLRVELEHDRENSPGQFPHIWLGAYRDSGDSTVVPYEWVESAVNAHEVLGFTPTGTRRGALDVADQGDDKNAYASRHGVLLDHVEEWSGVGSDIYQTVIKAHGLADALGHDGYEFDADGLGAGVRGDARAINEARVAAGAREVQALPWRGSAAVMDPDAPIPDVHDRIDPDRVQRLNKDYFANAKAQGWFALRMRFQMTYRAVQAHRKGLPHTVDPDRLISISPYLPLLDRLKIELSQPTYSETGAGKMLIDKAPDGAKSPNLADAVMILFAPKTPQRRSFFD